MDGPPQALLLRGLASSFVRGLRPRPSLQAVNRFWAATPDLNFLRRSAGLTVVAVALGVVSGAAVRLTGSGLGCSDWPTCTSTSVLAPLQYHAWVEFGNRLVNVLITVGVLLTALAALRRRPRRRDISGWAAAVVAGILGEVVLGGETVLHKLAPPWVMAHFLLGIALLMAAVMLYHRSTQPEVGLSDGSEGRTRVAPATCLVRPAHLVAARTMLALSVLVVVLGTVVTSTGPHAGAPGVARFKLSLHTVAQLHGTSVELLLALTVGTLWSLHRARVAAVVLSRAEILLCVLVAQAAVGYAQYLTGDPVLLVAVHVAGATMVVIAMMAFNLSLYARGGVAAVQTVAQGDERARELVSM